MRSATISTLGSRRGLVLTDLLRQVSIQTLILTGLVVVAIFLRTYQLEPFAFVPDQYDRLTDAQLMLSGKLPESQIYPPGTALLLVIPFALFSASLLTLQGVTSAFGIALVPLAYLGVARLTGDKRAGIILASFCALSPLLVLYSRAGYFDIMVTFLVALAVFLVPSLRGRSLVAFVAYGFLLALLVNIRPTNVLLIPAVVLYWLTLAGAGLSPSRLRSEVMSARVATTAATFTGLCLLSIVAGEWFGGGYSGLVSFENFFRNLLYYWGFAVSNWLGLFLVPPALAGAARLWRLNRPLMLAVAWIVVTWPLAHAPFLFADGRYMTPVLFFVLMLAALGFSSLLRRSDQSQGLRSKVGPASAVLSLAFLVLLFGGVSAQIPWRWHRFAAVSDAGLAKEIRPVIEGLGSDAVLVSSVTRALQDAQPHPEFLDLFDRSLAEKDRRQGAALNALAMRQALDEGRDLYYLYSHMEAADARIGGVFEDHDVYFDVVSQEFTLTELVRTESLRNGFSPWILYKVDR